MSNRLYNENSTQHIDAREFTRKRPGTYCGSVEYSTQLVKELFANALDEHNIGHGSKITISVNTETNQYTVEDEGQGFIPNAKRPNGETMLSECFAVINTSGKYDDTDDSVYGGSALGLNGIGMKLVCYLSSTSMATTSNGNGKRETIWYKDGIFSKRDISDEKLGVHGTKISYIPDSQFFQNKEANFEELKQLFEEISALCPTLTIILRVDDNEQVFHSENGINNLIDKKVKEKEILSNRFVTHIVNGNDLIDVGLTYTEGYSEDITSFVNYGKTDSGVHLTALRSLLTKAINKFANDNNLFKKNENNLTGQELSEGLIIVFNLKAKKVAYDSQSKVRVVDIDKTLITKAINEDFTNWMNNNPKEIKKIVEKALLARKARDAAKKARDAARNKGEKKNRILNLPTKLIDAWSKNRMECELLIAEGDSAAAGLVEARDSRTQAVFPIRGKILSTLKATDDKIWANQEIVNISKALGLDVDAKTRRLIYDKDKLRYGKIVMCADADPDGEAIKNLLITCFWVLCPELILNGHLYAAVPPLFRITTKKNEYIYLRDAAALEEYKVKHAGEKYLVSRSKGLGEQDSSELDQCLLDPETRNVVQLTVESKSATEKMLDILMGPKVEGRREYMIIHGEEARV
jgi:DNA gyrase subunit B